MSIILYKRETVNSILTATKQEQTTNIINAETNQINRNNLSKISSAVLPAAAVVL